MPYFPSPNAPPASTVVDDATGAAPVAAVVGALVSYAREDHDHGNPGDATAGHHGWLTAAGFSAIAALVATYQPLDADLTAIAALTTTSFGRSFLALADATAGRTLLGLGTAATQNSTAFDTAGAAAAAQAASQPLDSDLTAIAALATTSFGRTLLTLADAAALRTTAGLGTVATLNTGTGSGDVPTVTIGDARWQASDADLTAIAALATTAYGRDFLTRADAAGGRTYLGLGTAAVADVGTGASNVPTITQADLRYQALDSDLTVIAALATTSYGRALLTLADGTALTALLNTATAALKGLQSATDFARDRRAWDSFADFGIIEDLRRAEEITTAGTQVVATSGSPTVNIPNAGATTPFSGTTLDAGKRITITGAGVGGAQYVGTIVTSSGTTCTVTPNPSTTVTATTAFPVTVQWGTDNATAAALMVSTLNASSYPTPLVEFGKYANSDWTNSIGFTARMVFNKAPWFDGVGGFHTTDVGDYTKIGGTRLAWWGSSSDGGSDFGAFITVSPTGAQALKRPKFTNCYIDGRNGDQNQALFGLKMASCHGSVLGDGFGAMDCLAAGIWCDIATSPTEAKDTTRFDWGRLCFRQLDNNPTTGAPATTTVTAVTAVGLLTNVTPIILTLTSVTGYNATGGYALVSTTSGRRHLIKYATVSGSTLTGCVVATEDVVHTPMVYVNAMIAPCQPGNGGAMKLSGGSGANTSVGRCTQVQISYGTGWGQAAVDCGNTDSIVFESMVMNGGSNVTEANGNRQRRPGVQLNGSIVANTLACRNMVFRDVDPGGAPGGAQGGISSMALTNAGALMVAPAGPSYVDLMQMGNGSPVPTIERGSFLDWNGNGCLRLGALTARSTAESATLTVNVFTKVPGTEFVMPPQGWQIGTHLRFYIPLRKTNVGTSFDVAIRANSDGVAGAGGTQIATLNYTGTAAQDEGLVEVDLIVTGALGAACAAVARYKLIHALAVTGLATGVTTPASFQAGVSGAVLSAAPTMTAFNSAAPGSGPVFVFAEVRPVTAASVFTLERGGGVDCVRVAT